MIRIIQAHNRLNGLQFVACEFGLIAVLVGWFAAYYLLHARWALGLTSLGITLNCIVVAAFAAGMWRAAARSGANVPTFWDRSARQQHLADNPHLLRDTLLLVVATLLPFVLLLAVGVESGRSRPRV